MLIVIALLAWIAQAPAAAITVDSRSLQPGEVVRLTLRTEQPADGVGATALGREWPTHRVDPLTWEAIVGLDLDVAIRAHEVAFEVRRQGQVERVTASLRVRAKTFGTRRLTVDSAFVDPPTRERARIEQEATEIARLWADSAGEPLWTGPFVAPVPHEANSAFGSRSVFNGQARRPHGGADFLSPAGTPVRAPNGGLVRLARDLYYTGGTVVIDHGLGLVSLFAHLQAIDVEAGQVVKPGDVVGRVGATGRVTGAHLHWTVRIGGARVDPLSLLAVLGAR